MAIFLSAVVAAAMITDAAEGVCDGPDEVCLLQLRKSNSKHSLSMKQSSTIFNLGGEGSSPLDAIAAQLLATQKAHGKPKLPECPGGALTASADAGLCTHGGIEIKVDFDDEDIEESFGDNVLMKRWKYFIQGCKLADCQLVNPDVRHHTFHVGKTEIRVEGYDLANNFNQCIRTVYVLDRQDPVFTDPQTDLNQSIEIYFPENACSVSGATAFAEYEEQAGFTGAVTDNCDEDVEVQRKIFAPEEGQIFSGLHGDENMAQYPNLTGPGVWTICYIATDDYSKNHITSTMPFDLEAPGAATALKVVHHCVEVVVSDNTPPYGMKNCPEDKLVLIDPHETEAHNITWELPEITGDNCEAFGTIPDAEEQSNPPKYPGMTMPVGSHSVNYALFDASRNVLENEECSFTVEVKQRAHPVELTCPPNVTFPTLTDASFAIVVWEDPMAIQGGKILDQSHISYPQGVSFGLPFPFGTTHIKVRAEGEITGLRHDEHLQFDECTFAVTVEDPQIPEVDGRLYRCMDDIDTTDSSFVKPYRVCGGTDLTWTPHAEYIHTHGYDVAGVHDTDKQCCTDQFDVEHVCVPVTTDLVSVKPLASYCKPKPLDAEPVEAESVEPPPKAPKQQAPPSPAPPKSPKQQAPPSPAPPKPPKQQAAASPAPPKSPEQQAPTSPAPPKPPKQQAFPSAAPAESVEAESVEPPPKSPEQPAPPSPAPAPSPKVEAHWTADGCPALARKVEMELHPNDMKFAVRCCSDSSDGNVECSSIKYGSDECFPHEASWTDAAAQCSAHGARLCTKEELLKDVCCRSGCGMDGLAVWTSSKQFLPAPEESVEAEPVEDESLATSPPVEVWLMEKSAEICAQYDGTPAFNSCRACSTYFPGEMDKCMGCGGDCGRSVCEKMKYEDITECVGSKSFSDCHLQCMGGGHENMVSEAVMWKGM